MKRHIFTLSMLALCASVNAQMKWNQRYQEYIDQYKDVAIEQMLRYKIPASITLAQGLLESGAGTSELTRKGNNHFGIKCHGWKGATTYHDDDARNECFRAYDNAYASYEDHSKFLAGGKRYQSLFTLGTRDYKGWAKGLKKAGYATNPQYANKLIDIIQLYKLNKLDSSKSYDKFMAQRAKDHGTNGASHLIYEFNSNYYVKAKLGDTFKSIAQEVGISARRLARYNERNKNDDLMENEIIYLKAKRNKAPKDYKGRLHYVKNGESMYSIAQLYGIKLKRLYKLNRLSPDYEIKVGDSLRLR